MYFKSKINPCLFIAEVGSAHEGSYKNALKLISSAVQTNADVIKLQIYTAENMVSKKYDPKRFQHFKKLELNNYQYATLLKKIRKGNKITCASVWDHKLIKYFNKFIDIFKIGSGDILNFQIIKKIIKTKKPVIISTGLCNLKDIKLLYNFIKKTDYNYIKESKVALLHCNTSYPTPSEDANLGNIKTLKKFKLPTGYSDHCIGSEVLFCSFLKGAQIIEKHFSNNTKLKTFRDHQISLDKKGVNQFLEKINDANKYLNKKEKNLTQSEIKQKNLLSFRRSIYAKKKIKKGQKFTEQNIICLRPYIKSSSSINFFKLIKNKNAKKNYNQGDIISSI